MEIWKHLFSDTTKCQSAVVGDVQVQPCSNTKVVETPPNADNNQSGPLNLTCKSATKAEVKDNENASVATYAATKTESAKQEEISKQAKQPTTISSISFSKDIKATSTISVSVKTQASVNSNKATEIQVPSLWNSLCNLWGFFT